MPLLVEEGKGLIDPCPLWDSDGKAYLVHAYAGSRAGIKSILVVKELNPDGTGVIGDPVLIYDGHEKDPTIEGPKIYKQHGYYYVFAPAGGVSTGWQTILRSKNIYGPYERKQVLSQGGSPVNGPHQGAWIQTQTGEDWFLHFQDKGAYGRVVHLQPMKWLNDWPVIGKDDDGDGNGEPVTTCKKPNVGKSFSKINPSEDDEFNGVKPGLQWQWQANPKQTWSFLFNGKLRMFSVMGDDSVKNYWSLPNLLMQKLPAEEFVTTAKITFQPRLEGEKCGLIIFGEDYAYIGLEKKPGGNFISFGVCLGAEKGLPEKITLGDKMVSENIFLRVQFRKGGNAVFSYSGDGNNFQPMGENFTAKPGRWVGARIGFFCTGKTKTNDAGFADIDYIRFTPVD
jgi:beta-xylosidase